MSQSNYEKYAVVKQQELLHKERNLQQAISCLRDRKKFVSLQSIDNAIDFVADLYDLSIDEDQPITEKELDKDEYIQKMTMSALLILLEKQNEIL